MDARKFVKTTASKSLLPSGQAETESEFHGSFCGSCSVVDPVGASSTEIFLTLSPKAVTTSKNEIAY
jgi:hypothetical protein